MCCCWAATLIGACGQINGSGLNLGFVQSSLQVEIDGSISIVYMNGDKCGTNSRYSTRIIFQCDDSPVSTTASAPITPATTGTPTTRYGSTVLEPSVCRVHPSWSVRMLASGCLCGGPQRRVPSGGCRVRTTFVLYIVLHHNHFETFVVVLAPSGTNCKVKDPRSGSEYDLTPLAGKDYTVKSSSYEYHLAVCSSLTGSVCPHGSDHTVASCQVEGNKHRISGQSHHHLQYFNHESGFLLCGC